MLAHIGAVQRDTVPEHTGVAHIAAVHIAPGIAGFAPEHIAVAHTGAQVRTAAGWH